MIPDIGRLPEQKLADHQTGNGAETAPFAIGLFNFNDGPADWCLRWQFFEVYSGMFVEIDWRT